MEIHAVVVELAKLDLHPGDKLVVKVRGGYLPEFMDSVHQTLVDFLDGEVSVAVMSDDIDLVVIPGGSDG